jgi:chromosome segregation ATPase
MKKIAMLFMTLLFATVSIAQKAPKQIDPEIKELQDARDTIKAELKIKTSLNTKNFNKFDKLQGEKAKLKDQYSSAKKAKKTDKMEAIQEKITENQQAIKDMDLQLKEENKDLDRLDKELKNAEKNLQKAKDRIAKEKSKK